VRDPGVRTSYFPAQKYLTNAFVIS